MHHFERLSNFGCTFNFFASKWKSCKNFEIKSKQCISFPLFSYFNYTNQNKKAINVLEAQIRTWGNYKLIETSPIIHHFSKNYIFYCILCHSLWDLHATFPKFLKWESWIIQLWILEILGGHNQCCVVIYFDNSKLVVLVLIPKKPVQN
jgi:hypothetical protein